MTCPSLAAAACHIRVLHTVNSVALAVWLHKILFNFESYPTFEITRIGGTAMLTTTSYVFNSDTTSQPDENTYIWIIKFICYALIALFARSPTSIMCHKSARLVPQPAKTKWRGSERRYASACSASKKGRTDITNTA